VYEFGEDIRTQLIITDKLSGAIIGESQHKISPNGAVADEFLVELREALRWLRGVSTDRVNTRFDLVRRRVSERWGINLDYSDCVWETIHGDLHWKNIAGPRLEIIDWEGWGIGLQHQDLAFLIALSGLDQILASRIRRVFRGSVVARSLTLAELFVTAELLRASENHGEHPDLVPALTALGIRARDQWLS
jgi:Ser/Thr protein kinase RdoA (MazF antagonist)